MWDKGGLCEHIDVPTWYRHCVYLLPDSVWARLFLRENDLSKKDNESACMYVTSTNRLHLIDIQTRGFGMMVGDVKNSFILGDSSMVFPNMQMLTIWQASHSSQKVSRYMEISAYRKTYTFCRSNKVDLYPEVWYSRNHWTLNISYQTILQTLNKMPPEGPWRDYQENLALEYTMKLERCLE